MTLQEQLDSAFAAVDERIGRAEDVYRSRRVDAAMDVLSKRISAVVNASECVKPGHLGRLLAELNGASEQVARDKR
jgi:hypothetical protein